jgi:hypothetical protein
MTYHTSSVAWFPALSSPLARHTVSGCNKMVVREQTHTQVRTYAHVSSYPYTPHIPMKTLTHTHTHKRTHTHTHTQTHTRTYTHTHSHPHPHPPTLTHTRTRQHIQLRSYLQLLQPGGKAKAFCCTSGPPSPSPPAPHHPCPRTARCAHCACYACWAYRAYNLACLQEGRTWQAAYPCLCAHVCGCVCVAVCVWLCVSVRVCACL